MRVSLLLAVIGAVLFIVATNSGAIEASSSSPTRMSPARLAQYLHLQKTLDGKRKRSDNNMIRDSADFKHSTTSKHNHHGSFQAHGDHVHAVGTSEKCGALEAEARMRERFPELGTAEDFEMLLGEKMQERRKRMSERATVNPPVELGVAVHIIHSGEAIGTGSNLALSQITSQIDVLNNDYGGGTGQGANCQISFKLEVVDRIDYNSRGWSAPPYGQAYIDSTIKPTTSTDPNNYLNLWVLSLGGGLLGYAQFPSLSGLQGLDTDGGASDTDGVVILNSAFGNTGTATAPYNGGRTATHEIGHFLGLRHIWGDGPNGTCTTDYCDNTPPAAFPNYGCPSPAPFDCGGFNQIQNYMDYTDDACMDRFMSCQMDRMYTVLENSPRRGGLIIFANVSYDATLTLVEPVSGAICLTGSATTITPAFKVGNQGIETLYNATISIQIDSGTQTTNQFTFPGGLATNQSTSVSWPTTVDLSSLTEDVHSLTATIGGLNGNITDEDPFSNTDSAVFYISKNRPDTYSMNYEGLTTFPPTGWTVVNGGWTALSNVPGADGSLGISAVSPMYELERVGTSYAMIYVSGVTVGGDGSTITFDIAYAPYSNGTYVTTGDSLVVLVEAQCTSDTQQVYSKSSLSLQTTAITGNSYVPSSSSEWRTESAVISNSALFGKSVTISFITTTGWGNNLWLDNINVATGQNGAASNLRSWLSQ